MRELVLNGRDWKTPNDFFDAFFAAVGAPAWHGRNFDALTDSIKTGGINAVEVPYLVTIKNVNLIGPSAQQVTSDFISLIKELGSRGCPVEVAALKSD